MRAAKQVVSQRRDEFNQAVRDAIEDGTEAWQVLETGRAQIQAFSAAVQAAEIALEGVREEANVGSRTLLDVLDAEQNSWMPGSASCGRCGMNWLRLTSFAGRLATLLLRNSVCRWIYIIRRQIIAAYGTNGGV